MSSEDFVSRLGLQLREAALREEQRSPLAARLAGLRYAMPRGAAVAAGALAALLVAAVIALGGLNWGSENTVVTPKVIKTFTLAEELGTMGAGYGSVWAVDTSGQILRVDPRTRQVRQRIPVAPDAILNVGAGAVWVLETSQAQAPGGRVLRIEPTTGRVTARARVQIPTSPGFTGVDIVLVAGRPWVIGPLGVVQLDPETLRPVQRVSVDPADGEPQPLFTALTEQAEGLWVLTRDQRIKRYDLGSGDAVEELPARLPGAVALVPTAHGPLMVTREAEYALADRADGRLKWRRTIGTGSLGPPGIEGDSVITHVTASGGDRLVALDIETGETEYSVPLPEFGIAGAANVGRQIWIGTPSGKVMVVQR
jgi:hypothetical protein